MRVKAVIQALQQGSFQLQPVEERHVGHSDSLDEANDQPQT